MACTLSVLSVFLPKQIYSMKINLFYLFAFIFGLMITDVAAQRNANSTKVIAHRGAWKNTGATENSIAALQQAIRLGCYGSEFDVHMSADSVLFVHHDHDVQGASIEESTAAELSALILPNGEHLPTLEAYLRAGSGQQNTRLILEIKASKISKERSLAMTRKCVELVQQTAAQGLTDYISFDFDICQKIKILDPSAHVAYLNGDKNPKELSDSRIDLDYHFSVFKKNEAWITEAHSENLTTNVWTVNDQETMQWFISRKVDYITTNEPELLLRLLQ